MKKQHYFVLIYIVFLVILSLYIGSYCNPRNFVEKYKELYLAVDFQTKKIEENMGEITVKDKKNNWNGLIEKDIKDVKLSITYNSIFNDINNCYKSLKKVDNKNVLYYKRKSKISAEDLNYINKKENCLSAFNKYYSTELSNNSKLSEKMNKQIKIITEYVEGENSSNFEDLLINEVINISKIASLSYWLKVEYLSLYNY